MWKIKADTLIATHSGLRVGLRVEMPNNGPVRFSEVLIPWERLSTEDRRVIVEVFNRQVEITPQDLPLF